MERDLDSIARRYNSQTDFDRHCIEHETDLFLQGYAGGGVLELGCASGGMTRRLVDLVDRLVVVDGSRVYLDELRDELGDRAVFVHSLFEDFSPEERFRHILAARILEHLADPVFFLRKVRDWLESEGRLHVIVPNANSFHRLLGLEMGLLQDVHELGERDCRFGHLRVYDASLLESQLTQAGFDVVRRESVLLKPLSNAQMETWPEEIVQGLFRMTRHFPEHGNELYFQCVRSQS